MDERDQRTDPTPAQKSEALAKAPAPDAPKPGSAKEKEDNTGGSIKETLESILVAFILAFIFRAFVVEAFVIPTGSMAPTLMGAHLSFTCPDCGYGFDVNFSESHDAKDESDETEVPDYPARPIAPPVYCPNCGYEMPPSLTSHPHVHYGDRILVLKYLYMNWPGAERRHFLFHEPQRWDVVVFKSPTEPSQYHYQQNYIKRLIGRPEESIMVLDGDIYVKKPGEKEFTVQTKPAEAQQSLWRIVYNNDYHPTIPNTRQQPWTQGSGSKWSGLGDGTTGRVFNFDDQKGQGTIFFNANANPDKMALSDWLAYDLLRSDPNNPGVQLPGHQGSNAVSDLKLDLMYTRMAGAGPLRLKLTKLDHAFTAELLPGKVRLLHQAITKNTRTEEITVTGPEEEWASADLPSSVSQPLHVEFTNVDYRVSLRINGREYLHTTPEQFHPDVEDLVSRLKIWWGQTWHKANETQAMQYLLHNNPFGTPTIEITGVAQTCRVAHVSLWRDVYYTPWDPGGQMLLWGNPPGGPGVNGPMQLGKDEYFVMGDNSALSYDGRFWSAPIQDELYTNENLAADSGRVPGRFLLGKAFFVYWPAGHRPASVGPALVPDFGDMRVIH